jgi:hypothetical protein
MILWEMIPKVQKQDEKTKKETKKKMQTFSFDDDKAITRRIEKFKGKKDRVYRLGFGYFPGIKEKGSNFSLADMTPEDPEDDDSAKSLAPLWLGVKAAWVPDLPGSVIVEDLEMEEFLQKMGVKIKQRAGTVIISFPLDSKGKVDYPLIWEDPNSIEVRPFILDIGKYQKIKDKHLEYPLWDSDLKANLAKDGKSETFQDWEFSIFGKGQNYSVFRKLLEKAESSNPDEAAKCKPLVDNLILRIRNCIDNELVQVVGRRMTVQDLKERLGHASDTSAEVEVSTDEDVEQTLKDLDLGL